MLQLLGTQILYWLPSLTHCANTPLSIIVIVIVAAAAAFRINQLLLSVVFCL